MISLTKGWSEAWYAWRDPMTAMTRDVGDDGDLYVAIPGDSPIDCLRRR